MRQHFSVLMVAVRSTIYKTTGILLLMAAAETVLFWLQLRKAEAGGLSSLEELFRVSGIPLVSGAAFLLVCAVLSLVGYEISGSRMRYTIQRLSVREEVTVLLWAGHNMVSLIIFWAAQLGIALMLSLIYIDFMEPMYYNSQTLFLAFHRSEFLHSLLPLEETSRYFRNAALIFGIGIAAACFSLKQRRGQRGIAVVVLAAVTVVTFSREMGRFDSDLSIILLALAVAAFSLHWIFRGQSDEV